MTELVRLRRAVDVETRRLEAAHGERLQCRRSCSGCCVDGITVFEVEAAAIRDKHRELLSEGEPHPAGACAFLDGEGACRIYPERPYVCRTQGLPLRWLDEEEGEVVERRDICELNDAPGPWPDLTDIPAGDCWTLGPVEAKLRELQGEELARVPLRSLFRRG